MSVLTVPCMTKASKVSKLKTPGVAFKYTDTIRNKVVNYKQVIQEGVVPNDCGCHSASNEYVDINSAHVLQVILIL